MRLLTVIFTFYSVSLFSQLKPEKSFDIYVNTPENSIKTGVLNSNKRVHPRENVTYYWYTSNKIMQTQGGFDGKLLHGNYASFYLSNALKEKGCFKNGLKCGEWTTWYENGKMSEVIHWKNGKNSGICKAFNEKGELLKVYKMKNNKLHGTFVQYDGGKVISTKQYKNGKLIPETSGDKGKKEEGKSPKADKKKVKSSDTDVKKQEKIKKVKEKNKDKKDKKPSDKPAK